MRALPLARLGLLILLGASASASIACSGSSNATVDAGGTAACPVAPACPDAGAPSYKTVITPILQQACLPCHGPGGTAGYDESTYANVYDQRSPIFDQVTACSMPPVNGPQLTAAQRIALTSWLECEAPNN